MKKIIGYILLGSLLIACAPRPSRSSFSKKQHKPAIMKKTRFGFCNV